MMLPSTVLAQPHCGDNASFASGTRRLASWNDARRLIRTLLPALAAATTQARNLWPSKPVRLIVPSSPGGADAYARILAQALSKTLEKQFVVDKRPGGAERESAKGSGLAQSQTTMIVTSLQTAFASTPNAAAANNICRSLV